MDMSLKEERNRELYAAYLRVMRTTRCHLEMPRRVFFGMVVESGASRFFISERMAAQYINAMERGGAVRTGVQGRRLCEDLYRVYLRKREEMRGCRKGAVIRAAVMERAPSFYILPERASDIILSGECGW